VIRVYIRTSTRKQSVDMQIETLYKYLKVRGIEKYCIYIDEGVSGKTVDRKYYKQLVEHVSSGDIIYAFDCSRLWRNLQDQNSAIDHITGVGAKIITIIEGDLSTERGHAHAMINGLVNQEEIKLDSIRSKAGIKLLQDKCSTGEKVWNGRGPDKVKRSNEGYLKMWENRKRKQL